MKNDLTICMWNIHGVTDACLGSKLELDETKHELQKHDIIGIVETHGNDQYPISLPGYKTIKQINRPKAKKARRCSGGVIAMVKSEISKGVSYVQSPNITHDIIWLKLSKCFFHVEEDIYIAIIYISPEQSSHTLRENPEFYAKLECDVAHFTSKGKVALMGDMNARTGEELDFIADDQNIGYLPLPSDYVPDKPITTRLNQDNLLTVMVNCYLIYVVTQD